MTRLDGEKKSPLPWIIGLIVLALLAAAIYYSAFANKGAEQAVINQNGVELQNTASGDLGAENSTDANTVDVNTVDANTVDANTADSNMVGDNKMGASATGKMDGANANSTNKTNANAPGSKEKGTNAKGANTTATGQTGANSATTKSTEKGAVAAGNSVGGSQEITGVPVPMIPSSSANSKEKAGNDTVATRSKTIKTDDKTVIYEKSVKADGSLVRDKKIVPKPVEAAKKP